MRYFDNFFFIGCVSKPLIPGHILAIMYGGGASVQLSAPPKQIKKLKRPCMSG